MSSIHSKPVFGAMIPIQELAVAGTVPKNHPDLGGPRNCARRVAGCVNGEISFSDRDAVVAQLQKIDPKFKPEEGVGVLEGGDTFEVFLVTGKELEIAKNNLIEASQAQLAEALNGLWPGMASRGAHKKIEIQLQAAQNQTIEKMKASAEVEMAGPVRLVFSPVKAGYQLTEMVSINLEKARQSLIAALANRADQLSLLALLKNRINQLMQAEESAQAPLELEAPEEVPEAVPADPSDTPSEPD